MSIAENVREVRRRIAEAARRSGRSPDAVTLVAVAKSTDAAGAREAVAAGVTQLGENRVAEAQRKLAEAPDLRQGVTWRLVGHLQTNKAKAALQLFDTIDSVDSLRLVARLDHVLDRKLPILLEVNVAGEPTKHGFTTDSVSVALQRVACCERLDPQGLMTIAPQVRDPEEVRPVFRRLRELAQANGLRELSMGMTEDFEVAIEEGATIVRVGRAIFAG